MLFGLGEYKKHMQRSGQWFSSPISDCIRSFTAPDCLTDFESLEGRWDLVGTHKKSLTGMNDISQKPI